MSKVATKSNITLKGSVEIVTEFFGASPAPPGHTGAWPASRCRALPETRRRARPRRLQHQLNSLPTRHLPARDLPPREQVRLDYARHDGRRAQRLPRERAHAAVPCAACLPHSPYVGPRTRSPTPQPALVASVVLDAPSRARAEWLAAGSVQKLVVVVTGQQTLETLERWVFDVHTDKSVGPEGKVGQVATLIPTLALTLTVHPHLQPPVVYAMGLPPSTPPPHPHTHPGPHQVEKSQKEITSEIQAIIRQITASVTFLPLLDEPCTFDLLVYTDNDVDVPQVTRRPRRVCPERVRWHTPC